MTTPNEPQLHRAGGLSIAQALLFSVTIIPAGCLLLYSLGVLYILRIFTTDSLGPMLLSPFLVLIFLFYQTAPSRARSLPMLRGLTKFDTSAIGGEPGFGPPIPKNKICDFCGMEFGGEVCGICGRAMCDGCFPVRHPIQACRECLVCPICRSRQVWLSCCICGKWVCPDCFENHLCIECASKRVFGKGADSPAAPVSPRRLILEPMVALSDAVCHELTSYAKELLAGAVLRLGDRRDILDVGFTVIAVSPITGGALSVDPNTVVSLVNRRGRDARLRMIRRSSNWPICFVEGCHFAIGRRCVSCSRFVCPNHSSFCASCKKILCFECANEGLCKFCWNLKLGIRPKVSFREIARVLFRLYWLIPIWVIFISVFYYGEFLESVNPSLRPLISFGIIVAGPILAILYPLIRTLRRRSDEMSGGKE